MTYTLTIATLTMLLEIFKVTLSHLLETHLFQSVREGHFLLCRVSILKLPQLSILLFVAVCCHGAFSFVACNAVIACASLCHPLRKEEGETEPHPNEA